jgi:hypothetical protein
MICWLVAGPLHAQVGVEEIVVTAARAGEARPGTSLRKTGDYILLRVHVTNDTREEDGRKREIYETLRGALSSARRDGSIELSVVDDELVIPLRADSASVLLSPGSRPDTSTTVISVKTRIPAKGADGQALISKLKDFVAAIKPVGRTQLEPDGAIDISIVGPDQYRDEIVRLAAEDARKATAALGTDYRVVVHGLDRPVEWARAGLLDLALFVSYSYTVLPSSVTSYLAVPADD